MRRQVDHYSYVRGATPQWMYACTALHVPPTHLLSLTLLSSWGKEYRRGRRTGSAAGLDCGFAPQTFSRPLAKCRTPRPSNRLIVPATTTPTRASVSRQDYSPVYIPFLCQRGFLLGRLESNQLFSGYEPDDLPLVLSPFGGYFKGWWREAIRNSTMRKWT